MASATQTLLSRPGPSETFTAPEKFARRVKTFQRLIVLVFCAFVLAVTFILFFVPIDESVRARGVVGARDDEILFATEEGSVAEIKRFEGAKVTAGEVILRMDTADLERQRLLLQNQLAELKAEHQQKLIKLETTRKNPLPKEFLGSESELARARSAFEYQQQRLKKLEDLRKQGYASDDAIQTQQLATKAAADELRKAEEKFNIVNQGYSENIIKDSEAEVTLLQTKVSNLERLIADLDKQIERRQIRAGANGIITMLNKRHVGEPIARGERLAHISSSDAIEVKLFVRQVGVNRIEPNQEVRIRSSVYNWQRYGLARGTVRFISQEPSAEGGSAIPDEHHYLVVANVHNPPRPLPLGSTVNAEIVIRNAAIWKLLFERE